MFKPGQTGQGSAQWAGMVFDPTTLMAGAAIIGGGLSYLGAKDAADTQSDAANRAAGLSQANLAQTRADLAPFRDAGGYAVNRLAGSLPALTAPINLSQEWLESTPGYKFTLDQGLKSVQNAAAAKGLGISGAALKGAANFATGLADSTYKTQFDAANTNRLTAYNMDKALADLGANAAGLTGNLGTQNTGQTTSSLLGGANAQAAGTIGGLNALTGGLNTGVNNYLQYQLLNKLMTGQGGGTAAGSGTGLAF